MSTISAGARRLPFHHVTIRVPWHDGGWSGTVCARPLDNSSCLILPRIGEGRRDDVEARCAGQRLDELDRADLPPCAGERVSFMAPFGLTRTMTHRDPRPLCAHPLSAAGILRCLRALRVDATREGRRARQG